ncbi:hypothetical protein N657DRAFT_102009 [Parathielavia appendiculata]|uniref:Uncharacterized protein n=1 Tax=Parathielavia appendiculata TaxID=2587402 RepID=A0AAN6TWJ5_9PEZI|nr:hypothetical protein N657DRAFT_102009 [Parathielavia appendiculata]
MVVLRARSSNFNFFNYRTHLQTLWLSASLWLSGISLILLAMHRLIDLQMLLHSRPTFASSASTALCKNRRPLHQRTSALQLTLVVPTLQLRSIEVHLPCLPTASARVCWCVKPPVFLSQSETPVAWAGGNKPLLVQSITLAHR